MGCAYCIVTSPFSRPVEQMDPKFDKMAVESMQGALPLRIGSINVCYPPTFFRVAWAVVSPFLNE